MPFHRIFRRDRRGASAVEYGMLAGLVAVAAITAVNAAGGSLWSPVVDGPLAMPTSTI